MTMPASRKPMVMALPRLTDTSPPQTTTCAPREAMAKAKQMRRKRANQYKRLHDGHDEAEHAPSAAAGGSARPLPSRRRDKATPRPRGEGPDTPPAKSQRSSDSAVRIISSKSGPAATRKARAQQGIKAGLGASAHLMRMIEACIHKSEVRPAVEAWMREYAPASMDTDETRWLFEILVDVCHRLHAFMVTTKSIRDGTLVWLATLATTCTLTGAAIFVSLVGASCLTVFTGPLSLCGWFDGSNWIR